MFLQQATQLLQCLLPILGIVQEFFPKSVSAVHDAAQVFRICVERAEVSWQAGAEAVRIMQPVFPAGFVDFLLGQILIIGRDETQDFHLYVHGLFSPLGENDSLPWPHMREVGFLIVVKRHGVANNVLIITGKNLVNNLGVCIF